VVEVVGIEVGVVGVEVGVVGVVISPSKNLAVTK
jgi:hypothetical protein